MYRNTDPFYILMKLESWDSDEVITTVITEVPVYPNEKTGKFMEEAWAKPLPWGYEHSLRIERTYEEGITIKAEIKTPDCDWQAVHRFADRIERFIKEELKLLEHGY